MVFLLCFSKFCKNIFRASPPKESAFATIDMIFVEGVVTEGAFIDTPTAGDGYVPFMEVGYFFVKNILVRER